MNRFNGGICLLPRFRAPLHHPMNRTQKFQSAGILKTFDEFCYPGHLCTNEFVTGKKFIRFVRGPCHQFNRLGRAVLAVAITLRIDGMICWQVSTEVLPPPTI